MRWGGERIERPDLHATEALVDEFGGEGSGILEEPPVVWDRARPDARVVDGNCVTARSAQQFVNGNAVSFACQVPECHVDGAECAHLRPTHGEDRQMVVDPGPEMVDPGRILTNQEPRRQIVHDRLGGRREVSNLAETNLTIGGMHVQPCEAWERRMPDRLNLGNPHGDPFSASASDMCLMLEQRRPTVDPVRRRDWSAIGYGRGLSRMTWMRAFRSLRKPISAFASPVVILVISGSRVPSTSGARKL